MSYCFWQSVTWRWSRWVTLRALSPLLSWASWWSSPTRARYTSTCPTTCFMCFITALHFYLNLVTYFAVKSIRRLVPGSFCTREVTLHVTIASFGRQGSVRQGLCPQPPLAQNTLHPTPNAPLRVVGLQEGGLMSLFQAVPGLMPGYQTHTLPGPGSRAGPREPYPRQGEQFPWSLLIVGLNDSLSGPPW